MISHDPATQMTSVFGIIRRYISRKQKEQGIILGIADKQRFHVKVYVATDETKEDRKETRETSQKGPREIVVWRLQNKCFARP